MTPEVYPIKPNYIGTLGAICFQKSHLFPLPPSHVLASTFLNAFFSPGSTLTAISPRPNPASAVVGVPPVWLKSTIKSFPHLGQFDKTSESELFATSLGILGDPVAM